MLRPRGTTLHVDLHGVTGVLLLEQLQLFQTTAPRLDEGRLADVAEGALNRLRRDLYLADRREPDPRPARAELVPEMASTAPGCRGHGAALATIIVAVVTVRCSTRPLRDERSEAPLVSNLPGALQSSREVDP